MSASVPTVMLSLLSHFLYIYIYLFLEGGGGGRRKRVAYIHSKLMVVEATVTTCCNIDVSALVRVRQRVAHPLLVSGFCPRCKSCLSFGSASWPFGAGVCVRERERECVCV